MKLKKETARAIVRDAGVSIFIYLLPVALMLLYFYFTGQRPWEKNRAAAATAASASITAKKTTP